MIPNPPLAGCEAAVSAVARGATILGTSSPGRFVAGLASSLLVKGAAIPPTRAADTLAAAVASRTRAILLQCAALERQGDDGAALLDMSSLAAIYAKFPPAADAPELEMVAEGLLPRLGRTERIGLLEMYDAAGGGQSRELVAVALGLPELAKAAAAQ